MKLGKTKSGKKLKRPRNRICFGKVFGIRFPNPSLMKTLTFLFAFTTAVCLVNAQQVVTQTTTTVTTYTTNPVPFTYGPNWFGPDDYFFEPTQFVPQTNGFINVNVDPYVDPYFYSPNNYTPPILHSPHQQLSQPVVNVINASQYYPEPCINSINNSGFNFILQSIANQSFEQNKLQVAQQILQSNYLTSQQVFSILQLFSFEQSKLSFAKSAFNRVIDPQNYFVVNNAFSFSSSVNDLNNFLRGF